MCFWLAISWAHGSHRVQCSHDHEGPGLEASGLETSAGLEKVTVIHSIQLFVVIVLAKCHDDRQDRSFSSMHICHFWCC